MSRAGNIPVHDSTRVRDVRVAAEAAHSDGPPGRWTPPQDTGLLRRDPAVRAAATVRDAGSAARPLRDDTSVAVPAPDRWTGTHEHRP